MFNHLKEADIAWLAGILEGEGSFFCKGVRKTSIHLEEAQNLICHYSKTKKNLTSIIIIDYVRSMVG